MKKWILIIMLALTIATVNAGFFVPVEGGDSGSSGLWAVIKGYFTSSACFPDWQLSPSACLVNNTRLKVYSDANSCGDFSSLPADNGTYYGTCDYCEFDLTYLYTSGCSYDNETQDYKINGTVYDSAWSVCCAVTGISSDCYSDDTSLLNYTYNGPFTCEEPSKMWYVAIAIILVGMLGIVFFIATNWNFTLLTRSSGDPENKNNAVKVLLVWLGFWLITPLIQLMVEIVEANSGPADIITLLETFYNADMIINYFISAYFLIYFLFNILLYFGVDVTKAFSRK